MKQTLYLGSYTKRESKGVHQITLDTEKKELEDYKLIAQVDSPTYITFSSDKERLYTISKEEEGAGITSFQRKVDGTYSRLSSNTSEDVAPCYIAYDESNRLLFTASYHGGFLSVYKEDAEGNISLSDRIKHEGKSVHKNQAAPHVHYTDLSPDRKYLLVCDLGTDELYTYTVSKEGKLQEVSRYKAKAGTGPRHIAFHPNGKHVYLLGELGGEIEVLQYDSADGSFVYQDRISTLPESHTSFNACAAIRVSQDGKFVYASNRGHDSIAVFQVSDADASLTLVEHVSTEGNTPRDFNFAPGERYVVVGHQDSDNLTLFERDSVSGKLTLLQKDIHAPECVCIKY